MTGTGGGWGDARERPVEEVVEDVADGYVTVDQAANVYGVVVDPDTLELGAAPPGYRDDGATRKARL